MASHAGRLATSSHREWFETTIRTPCADNSNSIRIENTPAVRSVASELVSGRRQRRANRVCLSVLTPSSRRTDQRIRRRSARMAAHVRSGAPHNSRSRDTRSRGCFAERGKRRRVQAGRVAQVSGLSLARKGRRAVARGVAGRYSAMAGRRDASRRPLGKTRPRRDVSRAVVRSPGRDGRIRSCQHTTVYRACRLSKPSGTGLRGSPKALEGIPGLRYGAGSVQHRKPAEYSWSAALWASVR